MFPTQLSNNTSASSGLPHCYSGLSNERPVVPGRLTTLRQACASLLEVVRMWLGQQHDLSEEEESVKAAQLPEGGDCWNETFKGCCFPFSNHKMLLLVGG